MSNKKSNFPNAQEPNLEPGELTNLLNNFNELQKLEKPVTDDQVEERLIYYFEWCARNDIKPGVEGMALSLGVSRQYLWKLQQEDSRRGRIILKAKQMLAAYMEYLSQNGKINPVTAIFLMKNHFNYADKTEVELMPRQPLEATRTPEEILEAIERDIPLYDED